MSTYHKYAWIPVCLFAAVPHVIYDVFGPEQYLFAAGFLTGLNKFVVL